MERIYFCPKFPCSAVFNDGHELWINIPETYRYRYDFLGALCEGIVTSGRCEPVRAYENPDGVILGLSGINRYQAILKLGWTEFPALFYTPIVDRPKIFTSDYREVTEEEARQLVDPERCKSVTEIPGYTYKKLFDPLDFLFNFPASEETRQRMFTCFWLEGWDVQREGPETRVNLQKDLVTAIASGKLTNEFYINICIKQTNT